MAAENKDSVEQAVKQQIEFYFSNSNLPRDKFLLGLTKENEGWVPIATLATFKKVKSLTTDLPTIVKALQSSETLSVNDDSTMVKRKEDIPDKVNDMLTASTVYAKGFPLDSTIETIQKVFAPLGNLKSVRLRKYKSNGVLVQKDSAFVEFSTPDEAKKVAAMQIPSLLDPSVNLKLMTKADYSSMKQKEMEEKKKSKRVKHVVVSKKDLEPEQKMEIQPDAIVLVSNVAAGTTREQIKEYMTRCGANVIYVDYNRGKPEGWVRLAEGSKASEFVKVATGSTESIGGTVPAVSALTGDAEKQYWQKVFELKGSHKKPKGSKKGKPAKKPDKKRKDAKDTTEATGETGDESKPKKHKASASSEE